jgi:hypothetical protein
MQIDAHVREAILTQPELAWTPAVDADGQVRDGTEACELTGWVTCTPGLRAPGRSAEQRTMKIRLE